MIPKAGGDYEYIMAAFGSLYGFLFVWAQLVIVIPTANAVAALTFADYILQPIYSTCKAPFIARVLIAASGVCTFSNLLFNCLTSILFTIFYYFKVILTLLNCVSVKWVTRIQNLFSAGKLIALLMIIGIGIYCLAIGKLIIKQLQKI